MQQPRIPHVLQNRLGAGHVRPRRLGVRRHPELPQGLVGQRRGRQGLQEPSQRPADLGTVHGGSGQEVQVAVWRMDAEQVVPGQDEREQVRHDDGAQEAVAQLEGVAGS